MQQWAFYPADVCDISASRDLAAVWSGNPQEEPLSEEEVGHQKQNYRFRNFDGNGQNAKLMRKEW